jgi:hypothetical protein
MTSRRWDRGRRSRSAAPLNIQGTLGTLLRTTLHQMGVVKDAVERQARSSLSQLDAVMLQRRQREMLARLGEVIWERARNGELVELAEHGEIAAIFDELAELEARAPQGAWPGDGDDDRDGDADDRDGGADDDGTVSAADWAAAPPRGPAANRGPAASRRGQQDLRVWRPSVADIPDTPDLPDVDEPRRDASPAAAGSRDVEPQRGRKAGVAEIPDAQERGRAGAGARPEAAARSRGRRPRRRDDQAAGGIAFMEDGPGDEGDDLGAYMHEDDVPRRG